MLEALEHERSVGQPGQRIMSGRVACTVRGILQLGARFGVEHIGSGNVSERLRGGHRIVRQRAHGVTIQIKRPDPRVAVTQRKREHGS